MKRAWIAVAALVVAGLLAGVALVGLPSEVDQTVVPSSTTSGQ